MIRLEKLQRKVLEIVEAESKITDKTRELDSMGNYSLHTPPGK